MRIRKSYNSGPKSRIEMGRDGRLFIDFTTRTRKIPPAGYCAPVVPIDGNVSVICRALRANTVLGTALRL